MLNDRLLIDAHVHAPVIGTLSPAWRQWAADFAGEYPWQRGYHTDGHPDPAGLNGLLEDEGVDHALLFCEYSPKATGIQRIEDVQPIVDAFPERFSLVANINPHMHFPLVDELQRQLDLGAVALKLHPVHGGFDPSDRDLYPVYARCSDLGIPVILHSGTSTFPGSTTSMGNPELMLDPIDYFRDLNFVFAHGGRGWWYDVAAFMALAKPNVWLDLAGLPPRKLPEYYARFDLNRLARRMIFGTDWPGVPGVARNAESIASLGLEPDVLDGVLAGNALKVVTRLATRLQTTATRLQTTTMKEATSL